MIRMLLVVFVAGWLAEVVKTPPCWAEPKGDDEWWE